MPSTRLTNALYALIGPSIERSPDLSAYTSSTFPLTASTAATMMFAQNAGPAPVVHGSEQQARDGEQRVRPADDEQRVRRLRRKSLLENVGDGIGDDAGGDCERGDVSYRHQNQRSASCCQLSAFSFQHSGLEAPKSRVQPEPDIGRQSFRFDRIPVRV